MLITCKEFSEVMGIEYLQASNILKVLTTRGVAVESGTQNTTQRGRPTIIYEVPDSVTINLSAGTICEG